MQYIKDLMEERKMDIPQNCKKVTYHLFTQRPSIVMERLQSRQDLTIEWSLLSDSVNDGS